MHQISAIVAAAPDGVTEHLDSTGLLLIVAKHFGASREWLCHVLDDDQRFVTALRRHAAEWYAAERDKVVELRERGRQELANGDGYDCMGDTEDNYC